MAGGGQAGELNEDKLDKGMQVFRLEQGCWHALYTSRRSFPAAHLETGQSGKINLSLPSQIAELKVTHTERRVRNWAT